MTPDTQDLRLIKGRQVYIVRYDTGDESAALESLIGMVNNPALNFDWYDAALMSHQIGQRLSRQMKGFLSEKARK